MANDYEHVDGYFWRYTAIPWFESERDAHLELLNGHGGEGWQLITAIPFDGGATLILGRLLPNN